MVRLVQRTLLTACIALLIGCFAVGSRPTIKGNKLILPPNCWIATRYSKLKEAVPEFTKFDGVYPEKWPEGFKLPADTYCMTVPLKLDKAQNEEFAAKGYQSITVLMLIPMDTKQAVAYLRQQVEEAQLPIEKEEDTEKVVMAGTVVFPAKHVISIGNNGNFSNGWISVNIDPMLQDYSYVQISFGIRP